MLKSVYVEWEEADISPQVTHISQLENIKLKKRAVAQAILVHQDKDRIILTPAVIDGKCIHLLIVPKKCITVYKEIDLQKGFIEKKKKVVKPKKEKQNTEIEKGK